MKGSVRRAADANAYLHVWDAIVSILEGEASPGRLDSRAYNASAKIIKICHEQQQRCLTIYDREIDKLRGVKP